MEVFFAGNIVQFATTFLDANKVPVVPASVALTIRTVPIGGLTPAPNPVVIAMSNSAGTWTADWDTTGLPPSIVYWAAQATAPHGADEGNFELAANWATQ